jgi:CRISPR-associated endonuclease/helicase Cas3
LIIDRLALPRYDEEPLIGKHYPYAHQIIARDTIRNIDEFFLFITSPTGSGKTDSWAIPALKENDLGVVIALYPTNALAEDQYRSIARLKESLNSKKRIEFVTADTLGLKRDALSYRITKGEILIDIVRKMALQDGGIIVTNPDIFVYALKGYYYDEYLNSVFKNHINTVVFDEFHLYDLRQSDIILFMLHDVLLTDDTAMRKFIFLSATPNEKIENKVKNVIGGNFIDTVNYGAANIIDKQPIMPEVDLEFRHSQRFMAGESFLKDLKWFEDFKGNERMAIIFDSAHEVAVISDVLRRETDWDVCERSGFRKDSMDESFDVLVGNKAVEVGIDFKDEYAIQRLVFSGHTVSEFLQRFGRLRNPIPGVMYKAVCFTPLEVVNHFKTLKRISRQQLEENLRQTLHDPAIVDNFRWRYGYLEAYEYTYKNAYGIGVDKARIMQRTRCSFPPLTGGMPSDKKDIYFTQGLELIREHYFINRIKTADEIFESVGLLEKSTKPEILDLMEELGSFRGNGIDIAYFDINNQKNEPFGTYNAFFLLRWADMDILSKKQFKKRIPDDFAKKIKEVSERVFGYAIIKNWIEKPRYVKLVGSNPKQVDLLEKDRKPEKAYRLLPVVKNINDIDNQLDISTIVNSMKSKGLFCRYLAHSGKKSKQFYDIDDYTVLINFKEGSLAIGLDAIYVDCVIYDKISTA